MSTSTFSRPNGASINTLPNDPTQSYFHQQRALLVSEIAQSLDTLLTQLNRLNRGLESVIAVGNEFSSVEALWSQFEGVMGGQAEDKERKEEEEEQEAGAVAEASQA
jgi:DASH complex subunit DAD1